MAGRTLSLLAALLAVRADLDITNLAPEALDLTSIDAGLVGWLNSCSDGTHLYLCPRGSIGNPNLARVLLSDFSTVEHFDLSTASLNSDWGACFVDAAAGHVYYVPQTGNYAMRVSTSSFQLSGIDSFDMSVYGSGYKTGYLDGFVAGGYAYYAPYGNANALHGTALRIDTSDWSTSGMEYLNLAASNSALVGFTNAIPVGDDAYFIPLYNAPLPSLVSHGNVVKLPAPSLPPLQ